MNNHASRQAAYAMAYRRSATWRRARIRERLRLAAAIGFILLTVGALAWAAFWGLGVILARLPIDYS